MVSNYLSSCNSYQFNNIGKEDFQFLVTPPGSNTDAMAMKIFQIYYLFIKHLQFEIFLSIYSCKMGGMMNNRLNSCKATICFNHVFHQKFPNMQYRQASYYHYPLLIIAIHFLLIARYSYRLVCFLSCMAI